MKKIKLKFDELAIESFDPMPANPAAMGGTVLGYATAAGEETCDNDSCAGTCNTDCWGGCGGGGATAYAGCSQGDSCGGTCDATCVGDCWPTENHTECGQNTCDFSCVEDTNCYCQPDSADTSPCVCF